MICTISSKAVGTNVVCTVSSEAVCTDVVCAVCGEAVGTDVVCAVSSEAVGTDVVCAISGYENHGRGWVYQIGVVIAWKAWKMWRSKSAGSQYGEGNAEDQFRSFHGSCSRSG